MLNCIICNCALPKEPHPIGKICYVCYRENCEGRQCRLREGAESCTKCIFSGKLGVIMGLELEFDIIDKLDEGEVVPEEERPRTRRVRQPSRIEGDETRPIPPVNRERIILDDNVEIPVSDTIAPRFAYTFPGPDASDVREDENA